MNEPLKKVAALGLGLLFSFMLVAAAEVVLRLNRTHAWFDLRGLNSVPRVPGVAPNWNGVDAGALAEIPDRFLRLRKRYGDRSYSEDTLTRYEREPRNPLNYRARKWAPGGELIFDITYRYNLRQRRPTPGYPKDSSASIFLVGCSLVLGEGVSESETLGAFMQGKLKRTAVESLGFHGWGVGNHLSALRGDYHPTGQPNPYLELGDRPVVLVYIFVTDHIVRTLCPLSCHRKQNGWMLENPEYAVTENGGVGFRGKFAETRTFQPLLRWMADSALVSEFGLDWPSSGVPRQLSEFFSILNAYRDEVSRRVPIKDFYFVRFPPHLPFSDDVGVWAQNNGYKVLNLDRLALKEMLGADPRIPFDGHFTPAANYILSQRILSRIQGDHPDIR